MISENDLDLLITEELDLFLSEKKKKKRKGGKKDGKGASSKKHIN